MTDQWRWNHNASFIHFQFELCRSFILQTGVIKGGSFADQRFESSKLLKCLGRKYPLEVSEGAFENSLHWIYFCISLPNMFLVLCVGSSQEYHWRLIYVRGESVDSLSLWKRNFSVKGKGKVVFLPRHISTEIFKGVWGI